MTLHRSLHHKGPSPASLTTDNPSKCCCTVSTPCVGHRERHHSRLGPEQVGFFFELHRSKVRRGSNLATRPAHSRRGIPPGCRSSSPLRDQCSSCRDPAALQRFYDFAPATLLRKWRSKGSTSSNGTRRSRCIYCYRPPSAKGCCRLHPRKLAQPSRYGSSLAIPCKKACMRTNYPNPRTGSPKDTLPSCNLAFGRNHQSSSLHPRPLPQQQ